MLEKRPKPKATEKAPLNPELSVVAYDPGELTGCVIVRKGICAAHGVLCVEEMLQLAGKSGEDIFHIWGGFGIDAIVCERWSLYPHQAEPLSQNELKPVQVIGMIRVIAFSTGLPLHFQPASMAKRFCPNARLALYGWPLRSDHEKDAARHAITYLAYH